MPLYPLHLRPATLDDAQILLDWRNDPLTRAQSRHTEPLAWNGHLAWLTRVLTSPDCLLLVGTLAGDGIGSVRFARHDQGELWEVSIALDPMWRGQGLGSRLLPAAVTELRRHHPRAAVVAAVRPGNRASEALFLGAGFRPADSAESFAHYRLEPPPEQKG